jgi:hypothetical protein
MLTASLAREESEVCHSCRFPATGESEEWQVSSGTPPQDTGSQTAPGKGRWTVLGATFGFVPPICTSGLARLDKLNLPTWLAVTIIVASPIVGALLGLFAYVVVARTERESMTSRAQMEAVADTMRLSLQEAPQLKPGYILEVAVTHTPDGFRGTIGYRKERAGRATTSTGHAAGQKQPLPSGNGGTAMHTSGTVPGPESASGPGVTVH